MSGNGKMAKGIFSRKDLSAGEDSSVTASASQSDSSDSAHNSTPNSVEMVTATRQGNVGSPRTSGSNIATNGKRKPRESKANGHSNKRRRLSPELEDSVIEELSSSQLVPEDNVAIEIAVGHEREMNENQESIEEFQAAASDISSTKPGNHIRFGSEEPSLPIRTARELENDNLAALKEDSASSDDDEDDDEAPEVVDNSAQLLSLKVQAQKQKEAKKRDEILRKEKRRLQDEKNKSQAKISTKSKVEKVQKAQSSDDDLISESTATLQGSVVKDSGRRVLPALLPDDILNAEPVHRLPSPPPEEQRKDTRQHKFFQDVQKSAKDLHRGDVTIRVLESKKDMLPPKSSKAGRNLKAAWMAGQRSRTGPSGLKRVGGGPKSFVRR